MREKQTAVLEQHVMPLQFRVSRNVLPFILSYEYIKQTEIDKNIVLQSKDWGRMQEGCPVRRNKIDEGEGTPGDRISTCVKNGHSINDSSGNGEKN